MKNKLKLFFLILTVHLFTGSYAQVSSVKIDTIPQNIRTLNKNYKEKYLDNSAFDYSERSPSLLARMKQWIVSKIIELLNTSDVNAMKIFQIIKLIFYIIVLLGVIYLFVKIFLNKEIRWIFKRKTDSENADYNGNIENISEVNFKNLVEEAVEKEDYRLAVRYYYLWLLKGFERASLIQYDVEKTNFDYQMELSESPFSKDFKKASYYYSYIWYGEFSIGKNEFQTTSAVYNNLLKQIANV